MKNITFSLILASGFLSFLNVNLKAQCPPGDLILLSQADVDAFVAAYPNCTEIEGNLEIGDAQFPFTVSDITDISELSILKSISGSLLIYYNPFLQQIDGLHNIEIENETSNLMITKNSSLIDLKGLESIKKIGALQITENGFLISLEGLNNLLVIARSLEILKNSSLKNMNGLQSLEVVKGHFFNVFGNNSLINMYGLSNLSIIEGSFQIGNNFQLESLEGLNKLELIKGAFSISYNPSLIDFSGANNLIEVSLMIGIRSNQSLTSFNGLNKLKRTGGLRIDRLEVTDFHGFENLKEINGELTILGMKAPITFQGLSNLKTITGDFSVLSNHYLEDFQGLDSLLFLWGNLIITGNANLQSIEGLENVFLIGGGSVQIINNPNLAECDILSICSFLNSTGFAEIHDNAPGCNSVEEVELACGLDCAGLKVQATATRTTCGHDNGTATAAGSGGTPPYIYAWSTGDSLQSIENLEAGYYTVTITDAEGCQNHHFTSVGTSLGYALTLNTTDETFSGANDGTATAFTEGGEEPFVYNWSSGATSQAIQNLQPGSYHITVSDSLGCEELGEAIINSFGCDCIGIHSLAVHPTCFESCDGSLEILEVHNGQAPYHYLWSTGDSLSKIAYLCAGDYSLTLTDAYQCETTISYTIEQPHDILIEIDHIVHVHGDSLGSIYVTISGGTGDYRLKWTGDNNFESNAEDLNDLDVGCYVLEVIDEKYCLVSSDTICIEDLTNVQNDSEKYEISIYPNPVSNSLNVEYDNSVFSDMKFRIFNAQGAYLQTKNKTNTIDTKNLAPGVYILECRSEEKLIDVVKFTVIR